jgi:hypothetical protein
MTLDHLLSLEELRRAAVAALLAAGLHAESNMLLRDPPLASPNGWVEWERSLRDAQDAIVRGFATRPTICRRRALQDAHDSLENLHDAMSELGQALLAAALATNTQAA